jgi:hypothetical protein
MYSYRSGSNKLFEGTKNISPSLLLKSRLDMGGGDGGELSIGVTRGELLRDSHLDRIVFIGGTRDNDWRSKIQRDSVQTVHLSGEGSDDVGRARSLALKENGSSRGLLDLDDGHSSIGLDLKLLAVGSFNAADDVIFDDDTGGLNVVDGNSVNLSLDGDNATVQLGEEDSLLRVRYGDNEVLLIGLVLKEPVVSLLFGHVVNAGKD